MRVGLFCALCTLPLVAHAQEAPVNWTCVLDRLCPDVAACRDWDQTITIVEGEDGWQVNWNADLPNEYELIADMPAPEGAVQSVRVRSLLFRNEATQATQLVTFDSTGHVVVTGHQPHAGTQVVTGMGTCELTE